MIWNVLIFVHLFCSFSFAWEKSLQRTNYLPENWAPLIVLTQDGFLTAINCQGEYLWRVRVRNELTSFKSFSTDRNLFQIQANPINGALYLITPDEQAIMLDIFIQDIVSESPYTDTVLGSVYIHGSRTTDVHTFDFPLERLPATDHSSTEANTSSSDSSTTKQKPAAIGILNSAEKKLSAGKNSSAEIKKLFKTRKIIFGTSLWKLDAKNNLTSKQEWHSDLLEILSVSSRRSSSPIGNFRFEINTGHSIIVGCNLRSSPVEMNFSSLIIAVYGLSAVSGTSSPSSDKEPMTSLSTVTHPTSLSTAPASPETYTLTLLGKTPSYHFMPPNVRRLSRRSLNMDSISIFDELRTEELVCRNDEETANDSWIDLFESSRNSSALISLPNSPHLTPSPSLKNSSVSHRFATVEILGDKKSHSHWQNEGFWSVTSLDNIRKIYIKNESLELLSPGETQQLIKLEINAFPTKFDVSESPKLEQHKYNAWIGTGVDNSLPVVLSRFFVRLILLAGIEKSIIFLLIVFIIFLLERERVLVSHLLRTVANFLRYPFLPTTPPTDPPQPSPLDRSVSYGSQALPQKTYGSPRVSLSIFSPDNTSPTPPPLMRTDGSILGPPLHHNFLSLSDRAISLSVPLSPISPLSPTLTPLSANPLSDSPHVSGNTTTPTINTKQEEKETQNSVNSSPILLSSPPGSLIPAGSPLHDLLDNGKVAKSFDDMKIIGIGAFGAVFMASHKVEPGRPVYAIKCILLRLRTDENFGSRRYFREVSAGRDILSKYVVRYYGWWGEEPQFLPACISSHFLLGNHGLLNDIGRKNEENDEKENQGEQREEWRDELLQLGRGEGEEILMYSEGEESVMGGTGVLTSRWLSVTANCRVNKPPKKSKKKKKDKRKDDRHREERRDREGGAERERREERRGDGGDRERREEKSREDRRGEPGEREREKHVKERERERREKRREKEKEIIKNPTTPDKVPLRRLDSDSDFEFERDDDSKNLFDASESSYLQSSNPHVSFSPSTKLVSSTRPSNISNALRHAHTLTKSSMHASSSPNPSPILLTSTLSPKVKKTLHRRRSNEGSWKNNSTESRLGDSFCGDAHLSDSGLLVSSLHNTPVLLRRNNSSQMSNIDEIISPGSLQDKYVPGGRRRQFQKRVLQRFSGTDGGVSNKAGGEGHGLMKREGKVIQYREPYDYSMWGVTSGGYDSAAYVQEKKERHHATPPSPSPSPPLSVPQYYPVVLLIQMELCPGMTLRTWLDVEERSSRPFQYTKGKSSKSLELVFFKQLIKGIRDIHAKGIVHRDLKPENIFIDPEKEGLKIGDFGLARFVSTGQGGGGEAGGERVVRERSVRNRGEINLRTDSQMSFHGQVIGTPGYAPPEGGALCTEKADIYSASLILLELLCPRFLTLMERIQVLSDFRNFHILPKFFYSACETAESAEMGEMGENGAAGDGEKTERGRFKQLDLFVHLLNWMSKTSPQERPSAHEVYQYIKNHQLEFFF